MTHRTTKSIHFYSWFILALASLMLFYKYLLQVFPSVITTELMQDFQLSGAGLGNLAACYFYSYLITQLFSGYLIDRFHLKLMIIASIIISALGAFLFSMGNLEFALLGRTLMGIGAAFATVGYMKIAAIYFPANRFAFVSGLLTLGVMLGAVFGQAPLALLVKSQGWHLGLIYIAIAGGGISLLYFIFIHSKPDYSQTLLITHRQKITLADIIQLLKNKTNWYLTLYSGLAFAPMAVFGGLWGTPFIMSMGYSLTAAKASLIVSMVYVGFGFGGPLFGYLADRFGHRFRFMTIGLFLSLFSLLCIVYLTPSPNSLMLDTFLFGLGTGGFMIGFSVGKDVNPLHIAATVVAFINSGDAIFGAFSEPLIGKILDMTSQAHTIPAHFSLSSYQNAFVILLLELILAYVFLRCVQHSVTKKSSEKCAEKSDADVACQ